MPKNPTEILSADSSSKKRSQDDKVLIISKNGQCPHKIKKQSKLIIIQVNNFISIF